MKWLKQHFNSGFKILAAMVLMLSIGSANVVSFARHVHHSHVRVSCTVHRHHVKRNRHSRRGLHFIHRRHARHVRKLTRRQINRYCNQVYRQTIRDINLDRHHYGIPQLRVDHQLSKIANVRSHQLQGYFSYNTRHHNNEISYILNRRHVNYNYYGENIASSPLGTIDVLSVGLYNNPSNASQDDIKYHARNGYQLANNINNASMNKDSGDNNGHRANILDRTFKRIGVGTSYNTHDHNYYIVTEFIG